MVLIRRKQYHSERSGGKSRRSSKGNSIFYVVSVALCNSVQVGTVLFATTDLVRKCWTECDKSLLKARSLMQDVLPDPDCIDFSNPEAVLILLEYFHACFQIISTSTYGKVQNLMQVALSDALGGYLRAYVLPFTKKAYYAGQMKYLEAKKLFQLYDDIKVFLKTNGMGWVEPQKLTYRKVHVTPLPITGGALEACHQLFTIESPGKLHCFTSDYYYEDKFPTCAHLGKGSVKMKGSNEIHFKKNPRVATKNSKRFANFNSTFEPRQNRRNSSKVEIFEKNLENLTSTNVRNNSRNDRKFFKNLMQAVSRKEPVQLQQENETPEKRKSRCDCNCPSCGLNECSYRRVIVPLPVLDDCKSPHSIAVPFKKRPFRNLRTRSSAFVLEYYYVAVIKCFIAKGNTRSDIQNFNTKFYSWLISEVYPHLSEEQWYPGFGGVLRVLETIKRFGTDNYARGPLLQDIGYMFDSGVEFDIFEDKRREKARNVDEFEEECTFSKRHVLTAIIIVSLIWIFVFCAWAFYYQATRSREILHKGCSHEESFTHPQCKNLRWNENIIDFQSLVQFFKKKEEPECNNDTGSHSTGSMTLRSVISATKCHIKNHLKRKKCSTHQCRKQHSISCKDEDFSTEKNPELKKYLDTTVNAWPCQPCLVPFDKLQAQDKFFKQVQNEIQNNVIQTLWKKPSKEGHKKKGTKKRCNLTVTGTTSEETYEESSSKTSSASVEDETKSTEKPRVKCCCSETCFRTHSTTTNTSSNTQTDEKLSSATMEFFEEVISRHKLLKKCSSAQESNSEEEGSSSSENNS